MRPEADVRTFVLARDFPAPAVLAARALGEDRTALIRCMPGDEPGSLRLQSLSPPRRRVAEPHPPRVSRFRFGLSDADLGLSPEERSEFA